MFEFQNLQVYQRAKSINHEISVLLKHCKPEKHIYDQLKRAGFSILLNIAEGAGRFTNADKGHYYVMARGSTFECSAILDYLNESNDVLKPQLEKLQCELEEVSKMLYSLIKKYKKLQ